MWEHVVEEVTLDIVSRKKKGTENKRRGGRGQERGKEGRRERGRKGRGEGQKSSRAHPQLLDFLPLVPTF